MEFDADADGGRLMTNPMAYIDVFTGFIGLGVVEPEACGCDIRGNGNPFGALREPGRDPSCGKNVRPLEVGGITTENNRVMSTDLRFFVEKL